MKDAFYYKNVRGYNFYPFKQNISLSTVSNIFESILTFKNLLLWFDDFNVKDIFIKRN
jgi:hypothetical protein